MTPFEFVVLALASYRLQRIVTADTWYPTEKFRTFLIDKKSKHELEQSRYMRFPISEGGPKQERHRKWTKFWMEMIELFSCPWCWGFWTTLTVFTIDYYLNPNIYIWAAFAASGIVGFLGSKED